MVTEVLVVKGCETLGGLSWGFKNPVFFRHLIVMVF